MLSKIPKLIAYDIFGNKKYYNWWRGWVMRKTFLSIVYARNSPEAKRKYLKKYPNSKFKLKGSRWGIVPHLSSKRVKGKLRKTKKILK